MKDVTISFIKGVLLFFLAAFFFWEVIPAAARLICLLGGTF